MRLFSNVVLGLAIFGAVLTMIAAAVSAVFRFLVLPILGLVLLYFLWRAVSNLFGPAVNPAEAEEIARAVREALNRTEREEENKRKEAEREKHRDSDHQDTPYTYQVTGRHANETLAIRYGIANQEKKVEEYWYHKKGGELARNPSRDKVYYVPASTIRLQKTKRIRDSQYEVLLKDYRDRKAIAVIEKGEEYVKTFLPMQEDWFRKHADLELTLKGNESFTLKELANFHVLKAIGG